MSNVEQIVWTATRDPDYHWMHGIPPTSRELSYAEALLTVPGQFSVEMLADILACERRDAIAEYSKDQEHS